MNTISALFSDQANLTPYGTALVFGNDQLTYIELEEQSNQLAHKLISEGVGREQLIPICINRSFEMIIGILGILKAGATYVPIDPNYPKERINYILKDTNAQLLITNSANAQLITTVNKDVTTFAIDTGWDEIGRMPHTVPTIDLQANNLAYIIYTSGSTGNPKGVMIEHHTVCKYILGQTKLFNITAEDRILQFSSFCFDASVEQIFLALLNGAMLTLIDEYAVKDMEIFADVLNKNKISYLHATPGILENLNPLHFKSLKRVIAGGDVCRKDLAKKWLNKVDFYNEYGPTEITVAATAYLCKEDEIENLSAIPIGKALQNMRIYVLDEQQHQVAVGASGELYIGGDRLARGYHNLPELTAKAFVADPFVADELVYKTGDICEILPSGDLLFLGRVDDQVKIRGYRIELGEIEYQLNQFEAITQAFVLANPTSIGEKKLVAYYQSESILDQAVLSKYLQKYLPEHMVPRIYVPVQEIPLTSNGKVDKKALQRIKINRPNLANIYKKPQGIIEENIYALWAEFLEIDEIGVNDNFFELGGDSLLAQRIVSLLKEQYPKLTITKLYQFPTISGLAQYLTKNSNHKTVKDKVTKANGDIAVIGMAGRFPGADTINELWDLLVQEKEAITFFDDATLDPNIPASLKNDPAYVKARGIINNAALFDPAFFNINPKLAELMDPQQRIFLEITWEALEKAGLLQTRATQKIGVFAGAGINSYYEKNVLAYPELIENQGKFQVHSVNDKDFIASRTSYHLNLKGPAVSVNSACSTSLLAIAEAVNSLRAGQCDIALAGAASITSPINSGHLYQEGSMLSADGHCNPFNADSTGTLFSDGAGVVVLKNLETAVLDGDTIFAVVKGIGVNNDGGGKGSFTAPSTEGQADAITSAINDANVSASDISYIEAHGTATPLGDPIEFEGLLEAFGNQERQQFCAIGSIKSNIGHLTHAAGVAGFIKTCLALHHKMIPASLGFNKPNPHIDFKNSPFFVNAKLSQWGDVKPRLAGVSSFGVGGTNVHVVLESFENSTEVPSKSKPFELISWSAQSEKSLALYEQALATNLQTKEDDSLADIAYTLHKSRDAFKHRKFVVSSSKTELLGLLRNSSIPASNTHSLSQVPTSLIFSFPGQGAQFVNMGLGLYKQEPVYKAAIDQCAFILSDLLDLDIRSVIFAESEGNTAAVQLKNTKYTQPALFVTSYALAQLWMSWGVIPNKFIGHSVGEYVAAHFAGIFSLADALKLIANRGLMISNLPAGSMLSVRHNASEIENLLTEDLGIAAVNSTMLCVVAGPTDQIAGFAQLLDQREIANKPLFTSHAFHSSMMEPIIDEFGAVVKTVTLNKPNTQIISTVTGKVLTDEQATDINYWTTHLRNTVQFSKAVETALESDSPLFLEIGPGTVTSTLIKQIATANKKSVKAFSSLIPAQDALASNLNALGQLWINGIDINWDAYYADQKNIDLPTYQFDRQKYWLEPKQIITKTYGTDQAIQNEPVQPSNVQTIMRKENLTTEVKQVLEDASGIELNGVDVHQNFLEIGFDSLLLTQVATSLKRKFDLPITFRKLNEEYASITSLVDYLDLNLPAAVASPAPTIATPQAVVNAPVYANPVPVMQVAVPADNTALGLIAQQLNILTQQLMLLQGQNTVVQPVSAVPQPVQAAIQNQTPVAVVSSTSDQGLSQEEKAEIQKPFGATPKIERQSSTITADQTNFLADLTTRYNKKTAKSKAYTNESRPYMADPRVVTGFRPATKELVYPIVINKSKGSKLWDLDGNEYIDALNGFGSNMLGHQPDAIKDSLHEQLEKGYEVGPQHELAASVSKLVCEFTGFDRAALCSTGSEAVLGCIRIARTVTGRSLIVAFTGSYHGIVDEVLVRGTKKLKSFPAAAGIMPEAVQNILVLDYGTPETMAIIKERADEIAAVLVETVQSRRPEFVPVEFLKELRAVTEASGSVLIFDEVITGFRFHPGGAQAIFGIKADLASYGKVVGAGMPIGVIAGSRHLMDALDGGNWNYGDESIPEIGVTYFAGTFVRHPLALAAAHASLLYMKEKGPALQKEINEKGNYLSKVLNQAFEKRQLPLYVANYGSLWKVKYHQELPYSELMFVLLREKGIHIIDGFPCFMTEATTDADIEKMISAFIESMDEMINIGFFPKATANNTINSNSNAIVIDGNNPPVAGARLGKDQFGNPAWFIKDPANETKYLQLGEN